MEFLLIYDWVEENNIRCEQWVHQSFRTKEELLRHKEWAEEYYANSINSNCLTLYPAVRYDWDEFDQLF